MLEHVLIQNFAVIEDLEVDFAPGFLALTGETGAGKSIIVDALLLLMGERSSFDKIREGKSRAYIEGTFRMDDTVRAEIGRLTEEEFEDDLLILSRTLDASGKSSVRMNGHSITLSTVKKVSGFLLDIHSQQRDADYLKEEAQLSLLDRYAAGFLSEEEKGAFARYDAAFSSYCDVERRICELAKRKDQRGTLEDLTYQAAELEKADLQPNEMEELEEEKRRLSSFLKVTDHLQAFLEAYRASSETLYQAKKQLDRIQDEEFSACAERFNDAYFTLEDTCQEISDKFDAYADSISRLEAINDRLYLLHGLRRKYGYTSEDILLRYEEIRRAIEEITDFDALSERLENEKAAALDALSNVSEEISLIRKKYASELEKRVNRELKDLYLEHAAFRIDIAPATRYQPSGKDDVRFLLRANAGGSFLPLAKTASLGETSRMNLALKTVFNRLNPRGTIVFDEIDIGISGRVATAVAKKMKEISRFSQVIAISHLAQVCAGADTHYSVSKEVRDGRTYSSIRLLSEEERVREIAAMMTGSEDDPGGMRAAKALMESFAEIKE